MWKYFNPFNSQPGTFYCQLAIKIGFVQANASTFALGTSPLAALFILFFSIPPGVNGFSRKWSRTGYFVCIETRKERILAVCILWETVKCSLARCFDLFWVSAYLNEPPNTLALLIGPSCEGFVSSKHSWEELMKSQNSRNNCLCLHGHIHAMALLRFCWTPVVLH